MSKKQYILIMVTGQDKPGITAGLMKIISKNKNKVLDMGQSVTHGLLSLSILLDTDDENSPVIKDLLFEAKRFGCDLDFRLLENSSTDERKPSVFILSCVSQENISPEFLGDIATTLANHSINIQRIDKLVSTADNR